MPFAKSCIGLAAILLLLFPVPARPQPYYKPLKDGVNVRADSTVLSRAVGTLSQSQIVEVSGRKYGWCRVKIPPEFDCWVWAEFIATEGSNSGKVKTDSLNVRAAPSLKAKIIGSLSRDDCVQIRSRRGNWLKIPCPACARGWINCKLLGKAGSKEIALWLEKKIPSAGESTAYNAITVLPRAGRNNPELIPYFFRRAAGQSLLQSALYLDVLENIVIARSAKIPFYYLARKDKLTRKDIQNAFEALKKSFDQKQYQ